MKNLANLLSALLVTMLVVPSRAQQSDSKITVEITREENGEQKTFRGEYSSEAEMYADLGYRDFVGAGPARNNPYFKFDSWPDSMQQFSFSFPDMNIRLEHLAEKLSNLDTIRWEELSRKLENIRMNVNMDSMFVAIDCFPDHRHVFTGPPPLGAVPDHFVKIEILETTGKDFGKKGKIGEDELLTLNDLRYFPNPSHGAFRLTFSADPGSLTINIYNLNGQEIYTRFLPGFRGQFSELVDLAGQEPGTYLLEIAIGDKRLIRKVIVE